MISIVKVFEFLGKPFYYLFTFIIVIFFAITQLFSKLLHSIKAKFSSFQTYFSSYQKYISSSRAKSRDLMLRFLHYGRNDKRKKPSYEPKFLITTLIILCSIGSMVYWYILSDLPSVKLLKDSPPSLSTKIYDRSGELLYEIYKDENRSLIKLSEIPKYVQDATISAEDKNFYHHHGIDFLGVLRALYNNLTQGTTQGGSTITQQLVKNTLLSSEKTITRKLKELILAIETEASYSKDEILEMYLNQVSYGGTAYGIEQASWQYFGKSARDLNLSESAMLAGLPVAPTILSPFGTTPYLGKIRQQEVLENMVKLKLITEDEKVKALSTPLTLNPQKISIRAPHFVMYIKDLLVKEYGEDRVSRGGLVVRTTLDLRLQDILQEEINTELNKLSKLHVQNGAGMIIDPKTGEILAMVGSRDFFDTSHDGQVNITIQERQPGSSIKPITYTLALLNGLTPRSVVEDAPVCYIIKGQNDYCPKNYDGAFHGTVTLRTALASSYNIPAVKLLNTYGVGSMISLAKSMGITTWHDSSRYGLSLTLGGGEVTMYDLSSVYSVFANSGDKVPLNPIISVIDPKGSDLFKRSDPQNIQVIPSSIAYQINSILSDPKARAPAFGYNSILNLPGKNVAVKTGTTNLLRDNWTFGYTSDYLVSTWVGNNDNTSMSRVASGVTGASPIWARTMKRLLSGTVPPPFTPPSNMVKVNLSCSGTPYYEYFVPGTAPRIDCTATPSGTLLDSAASTSN